MARRRGRLGGIPGTNLAPRMGSRPHHRPHATGRLGSAANDWVVRASPPAGGAGPPSPAAVAGERHRGPEASGGPVRDRPGDDVATGAEPGPDRPHPGRVELQPYADDPDPLGQVAQLDPAPVESDRRQPRGSRLPAGPEPVAADGPATGRVDQPHADRAAPGRPSAVGSSALAPRNGVDPSIRRSSVGPARRKARTRIRQGKVGTTSTARIRPLLITISGSRASSRSGTGATQRWAPERRAGTSASPTWTSGRRSSGGRT